MTLATGLAPGFGGPVHGAQQTFRDILQAMSHPGSVVEIDGIEAAPAPLTPTLAAVALTLFDHETPVYLHPPLTEDPVVDYLAFHTGANCASHTELAAFILCEARNLPDLSLFATGTAEYPDRSATLIIGVDAFSRDDGVTLTGPGIETERNFAPSGLGAGFWTAARRNHARYPLGLDFLFCAPGALAALPRSTTIAV